MMFLATHIQLVETASSMGQVTVAIAGAHDLGPNAASSMKGDPMGIAVSHFLIKYNDMKNSSFPAQKKKSVVFPEKLGDVTIVRLVSVPRHCNITRGCD